MVKGFRVWLARLISPGLLNECLVKDFQECEVHFHKMLVGLKEELVSLRTTIQKIAKTIEKQFYDLERQRKAEQDILKQQLEAMEINLQKLSQELFKLNKNFRYLASTISLLCPQFKVHTEPQIQIQTEENNDALSGSQIKTKTPVIETPSSDASKEEVKRQALESKKPDGRLRPPSTGTRSRAPSRKEKPAEAATLQNHSRVPPEKRGGRPRVSINGGTARMKQEREQTQGQISIVEARKRAIQDFTKHKLALVCQKLGREWQIFKETNEGQLEQVQVDAVKLDENEALLFKLDAALERGRQVHRISRGWYLAIVPKDWERLGPAPFAPEPVALPGYQAHYFDLIEEGQIRFRVKGQEHIPWQRVKFLLIGEKIEDGAQYLSPLFREPPKVRAPRSLWAQVAELVIREEKPGRGRWRISFHPDSTQEEQVLPHELAERGGGRYTLLFYDHNWKLLESFDFRFFSALRGIRIESKGSILLPGATGHHPAHIIFLHEAGCFIEPAIELPPNVRIRVETTQTEVELPPDPKLDQTYWRVRTETKDAAVDLIVSVPRIWWALGSEDKNPRIDEWQARLLSFSRQNFVATTNEVLWIRLPTGVRQVRCGFPGDLRPFDSSRGKTWSQIVAVPLREFSDSELLSQPGKTPFKLKFVFSKDYELNIGWLKVYVGCCYCDFKTFEEEKLWTHIFQQHYFQLYREPAWGELKGWIPELPSAIYQCPECEEYVEANDPENPTSIILRHLKEVHNIGIQPHFRVVTDPNEIREKVVKYHDLPRFQICKLCGMRFDIRQVGQEELLQHLKDNHRKKIIRLV